jgi:hypothetical protein
MKESRKEFIKKAHSAACNEWKKKIEKEFPKLFKKSALVIGKWYKRKEDSSLWFVTHIKNGCSYGYGFDYQGRWADESKGFNYSLKLNKATAKEVEEALIKEAKRRGFKKGVRVDRVNLSDDYNPNNELKEDTINTIELFSDGYLWVSNILIYDDGNWATIIETITKEQAEKELGKTILN